MGIGIVFLGYELDERLHIVHDITKPPYIDFIQGNTGKVKIHLKTGCLAIGLAYFMEVTGEVISNKKITIYFQPLRSESRFKGDSRDDSGRC